MKKIIIINFFVAIFLILFLEFTINFFKLSNLLGIEKGLMYKQNGSHYLTPNTTGKVFGVKVFIDKNGFRVPNKDYNYLGNKNFYILGDSTAFGPGVSEENTFIGLLRKKYFDINFYNSSVLGYQINNHIINLNDVNDFGQIDKIIYFYTLNDIFNSSYIVDTNKNEEKPLEDSLENKKVGRNERCPCGSGKKFKHCHGNI